MLFDIVLMGIYTLGSLLFWFSVAGFIVGLLLFLKDMGNSFNQNQRKNTYGFGRGR